MFNVEQLNRLITYILILTVNLNLNRYLRRPVLRFSSSNKLTTQFTVLFNNVFPFGPAIIAMMHLSF